MSPELRGSGSEIPSRLIDAYEKLREAERAETEAREAVIAATRELTESWKEMIGSTLPITGTAIGRFFSEDHGFSGLHGDDDRSEALVRFDSAEVIEMYGNAVVVRAPDDQLHANFGSSSLIRTGTLIAIRAKSIGLTPETEPQ